MVREDEPEPAFPASEKKVVEERLGRTGDGQKKEIDPTERFTVGDASRGTKQPK